MSAAPAEVVERLASRVGVSPSALARYAREVDGRLRRLHVQLVIERAGWRTCGRGEWKELGDWLVARALEHDTPSVLFRQALEHLRSEQVARPALDRLVRTVASAREAAWDENHWRLRPQLTPQRRKQLDALVTTDPARGIAPLVWLGEGATSSSAEAIKTEIAKLAYLRKLGADQLDLSSIPPERLRQMATLARRSTPKSLRRMLPERRHPILLAALQSTCMGVVDEVVRMFDQALASTDKRAREIVREHQLAIAEANVERLVLLDEILDVVLDDELDDAAAGARVRALGRDRLASAVRSEEERLPTLVPGVRVRAQRQRWRRHDLPRIVPLSCLAR
jgi:hypothetical protein